LIGKGPEEERLRRMIRDYKVEGVVKIHLWMERSELKEYYRKASVFLFSSHEGAGMVVPEALSYGIPVISFDNIGPGEFIDTTCGIKVPYLSYQKSVDGFADGLDKLFYQPDYFKKLSDGARLHYKEHFTWAKRGELLAQIYDQLDTKA
jgi:glycosyltransferase involved in cell wall biosynthesis